MENTDKFFVLDESRRVYSAINSMLDTDNANLLIVSAQSGFGKSFLLDKAVKAHGIADDWRLNGNSDIAEILWSSKRKDLVADIIAKDDTFIDLNTGEEKAKVIVFDCDDKEWFRKNIDLLEVFASTDPWNRFLEIPDSGDERHHLEAKIIILTYANLLELVADNEEFEYFYDNSGADTISVPRYGHKEELDYLHAIYPDIPLHLGKSLSIADELKVREVAYTIIADNLNRIDSWQSLTFKFIKVANYVSRYLEQFTEDEISPRYISRALNN